MQGGGGGQRKKGMEGEGEGNLISAEAIAEAEKFEVVKETREREERKTVFKRTVPIYFFMIASFSSAV